MKTPTLGFIGAGHLNSALIAGLQADKRFKKIIASARTEATAERISRHYKIKCLTDNRALIAEADYLILGVKPFQMKALLDEIAEYDLNDKIIITVCAGIPLEKYRLILGDDLPLVRAMPNIGALHQASLTGIYSDSDLEEHEIETVEALFSAVGGTEWLEDEAQIDGITALSGSGIAFIYRFLQAMMNAGERYGFEKEALYDILTQTVFGAGVLALENEEATDFDYFIKKIATPNGTTEAGLKRFPSEFDALIDSVLQGAIERAHNLGEEIAGDW